MTHYTTNERLGRLERMVREVLNKIDLLILGEEIIMSDLSDAIDEIEAAAAADADSNQAAIDQMVKLAKLVEDATANGTDPAMVARVKAVAAAMKTNAEKLVAAANATPPANPSLGGT